MFLQTSSSKEKTSRAKETPKESEIPPLQEDQASSIQITQNDDPPVVKIFEDDKVASLTDDIPTDNVTEQVTDDSNVETTEQERTSFEKDDEEFEDAQEDVSSEKDTTQDEVTTSIHDLDIRHPPEEEEVPINDFDEKPVDKTDETVPQSENCEDALDNRTEAQEDVTRDEEDLTTHSSLGEPHVENDEADKDQTTQHGDDDTMEELEVLPEDMMRQVEPSAPPTAAHVDTCESDITTNEEQRTSKDDVVESDEDVSNKVASVSAPPDETNLENTPDVVFSATDEDMMNRGVEEQSATAHLRIQNLSEEVTSQQVFQPKGSEVSMPRTSHATEEEGQSSQVKSGNHEPMTKEQLEAYYQNPMILHQEDYVEHFVHVSIARTVLLYQTGLTVEYASSLSFKPVAIKDSFKSLNSNG